MALRSCPGCKEVIERAHDECPWCGHLFVVRYEARTSPIDTVPPRGSGPPVGSNNPSAQILSIAKRMTTGPLPFWKSSESPFLQIIRLGMVRVLEHYGLGLWPRDIGIMAPVCP